VGGKGLPPGSGNLLFHGALLAVLGSVALGRMFGYKADKLLVEGGSFADRATSLDEFHPGRRARPAPAATEMQGLR
jgi:cytochrome c biogenesis protein